MNGFALLVIARLAIAAFFFLTWAYAVATYSPFAFDMFIQPQLMPSLTAFVAWHHLWYWLAYAVSVATLLPDLTKAGSPRVVRWLAIAYVVCFGAVGVRLVVTPYLPTLWNDSRSLTAALIAFTPLLWLALVDHVASWRRVFGANDSQNVLPQRRAFLACLTAAGSVWAAQLAGIIWDSAVLGGVLPHIFAGTWMLVVDLMVAMIVYAVVSLISALARWRSHSNAWEYALSVFVVAVGISELCRRVVLPSISFDARGAWLVSYAAGAILAAMWSGLRMRSLRGTLPHTNGIALFVSPRCSRVSAVVFLVAISGGLVILLERIARFDWDFVLQKTVVVGVWVAAFGFSLQLFERLQDRRWSVVRLMAVPLGTLAVLFLLPRVATRLVAASGDQRFNAEVMLDRIGATDVVFRFLAGALIRQSSLDPDYNRYMFQYGSLSLQASGPVPSIEFSTPLVRAPGPKPNIFVFVIDSLRRDYVSPYNRAVSFTPRIDQFARENFVFSNAFARYGGTWLSVPSIWSGGSTVRGWGSGHFDRLNAIEKLVIADEYRMAINDFTVAGHLLKTTPRTFLDPGIPSVDTDLCRNLTSLAEHLEVTSSDPRPVFTYLAPMNIHILNTRAGDTLGDESFPGFYAPYASRLKRIDRCFGEFIASLKDRGLYDESVIVVTGDHGDSLGEGGNWGHQFWMFPEDVRLPLIVHLPATLRGSVTTDLSRVAFVTDLAPTLYAILGHEVRDLGPLFGSPLFVPADRAPSARRSESFLLMSSYGPNYALLRRNGRLLYVSDLVTRRETAFDLSREPLGERVEVTDAMRRVNQRLMRRQVEEVTAFYHLAP